MSTKDISNDPLAPVIEFNRHLRRFHAAGLSFDSPGKGVVLEKASLESEIQSCEAALRVRTDLSQPLIDAIRQEQAIAPTYRAALVTWIETGDMAAAISLLSDPAHAVQISRRSHRLRLIQPVFLILLAILAFYGLLAYTVPDWQRMSSFRFRERDPAIQVPSSGWLTVLVSVRQTFANNLSRWQLNAWQSMVVLAGFMVIAILIVQRLKSSLWDSKAVSYASRQKEAVTKAALAMSCATILANRSATAEVHGDDDDLADLIRTLGEDEKSLLSVAAHYPGSDSDRAELYRQVARCYEEVAWEYDRNWRSYLPVTILSLLGLALVVVFAFSLFLPTVDMLHELAAPSRDS